MAVCADKPETVTVTVTVTADGPRSTVHGTSNDVAAPFVPFPCSVFRVPCCVTVTVTVTVTVSGCVRSSDFESQNAALRRTASFVICVRRGPELMTRSTAVGYLYRPSAAFSRMWSRSTTIARGVYHFRRLSLDSVQVTGTSSIRKRCRRAM